MAATAIRTAAAIAPTQAKPRPDPAGAVAAATATGAAAAASGDGCQGDFGCGIPDPPDLANERERPLAELRRRGRPDGVPDDDGGTAEPIELVRAGGTAGQVRGDRRRKRRVTGHQPVDAGRLRGRQLELLPYFVVVHGWF